MFWGCFGGVLGIYYNIYIYIVYFLLIGCLVSKFQDHLPSIRWTLLYIRSGCQRERVAVDGDYSFVRGALGSVFQQCV
jgi:hypothetical protein